MMVDVDIRLLTGGDIELAALPEAHIHGTVPRALFVVLALNAGQRLTRDYVADLLWTDADQSSARNRLRMTLFNLRQNIGTPLADQLKSTKEMLCLDVPRESVDVLKFVDICSNPDNGSMAEAIDLYRGDLLARFPAISENFDAMLTAKRDELCTQIVMLLQQSLSYHDAADETQLFENSLAKALQIDRTNSKTYEIAMRHFARAGMDDRIEEMYRRYEKAMDEDLDLPPSDVFRKLSSDLTEQARNITLSVAPADQPPERPSTGAAVEISASRHHSRRRSVTAYSLIGLMAAVLALLTAWTIFSARKKHGESDSTVFLVQPYQVQSENCGIDDVSNRYDRVVIAALRQISGSNVVLAQENKFAVPASSSTYMLNQVVICSNDLLRTTVILTGSGDGDIKWVGRYEILPSKLDKLTGRIKGDIIAALKR